MTTRLFSNRLARFLAVGVLNSIFGLGVFSVFIHLGSSTLTALVAGNVAGLVFNFFTTGGLVFKNLSPGRMPAFALCYVVTLSVNAWLIGWLAPRVGSRIVAQTLLTPLMAAISYVAMARVVFRESS